MKNSTSLMLIVLSIFILYYILSPKEEIKGIKEEQSSQVNTPKPTEPLVIKNEPELIEDFKNKWEAITLTKATGFPQYRTYSNSLLALLQSIYKLTSDTTLHLPKLEKLRLKLLKTKKCTEALAGYLVYGQPNDKSDLTYPCEEYLKQNIKDPSSLDISDEVIKGQSQKGWVVVLKYRAKNSFGEIVEEIRKFEVQYNDPNGIYQVINSY